MSSPSQSNPAEVDRSPAGQSPASESPAGAGRGPARRRFLQATGVAGAGLAATAALPASAVAAAPRHQSRTAFPDVPTYTPIRPAAVPLAVRSPYLSTWLETSNLPGTWPTFWTNRITAMAGIAIIDGTAYVFMGNPAIPDQPPFPTMHQTSLVVSPTRSTFTLEQAGVQLVVEFLSPVEPGDLARQSMPLSYVSVTASAVDKASHAVQVYVDISGEWASGSSTTPITWNEESIKASGQSLISLHYTPAAPRVLAENSDTAEWGTTVWSTAQRPGLTWQIGGDAAVRTQAIAQGKLTDSVDPNKPRPINDHYPVFAFDVDLGRVDRKGALPVVVSIGQVRDPAVSYLGKSLHPLWMSYYPSWQAMVAAFHADLTGAGQRADALEKKIAKDATKAGGEAYYGLCSVALRQAYGGTELVQGPDGKPWAFLKEISSDGNVSTIDVTYPSIPVFLYLDPAYLGLILEPILSYVENNAYLKTFAPHDLGSSYPNATGHLNGQGEEDMPVEESANMLIMATAYLARIDGRAAGTYAKAHYRILKQWADYLVANALDPGFQNQTDDFTGFIGHSVNLALKGIIGIGAMGLVATAAGNAADADHYRSVSKDYIGKWVTMAQDDSGDHLKLAYDRPGTWSLKYNGYSDRLLGLVPDRIRDEEAAWYLVHDNTYGVPLDIRHTYTKADWEMWTAAWLSDHDAIRDSLIGGLYAFADTTPSRVPMSDWYDTIGDRQVGFQARPVVGGFYALLTL